MIFDIFDIQLDSGVPIYEQIIAQMIYGIALGSLKPGETVLSVRKLAEHLVVNPNTVAKAYQELEKRGIVVVRRGQGMEVTDDGPAICRRQRQEILRERIRQTLREAALALTPEDLRRLVDEELARCNGKPK
jgi:GntR family transcriptional regulator